MVFGDFNKICIVFVRDDIGFKRTPPKNQVGSSQLIQGTVFPCYIIFHNECFVSLVTEHA